VKDSRSLSLSLSLVSTFILSPYMGMTREGFARVFLLYMFMYKYAYRPYNTNDEFLRPGIIVMLTPAW
jgi:hypothetical protein